MPRESILERFDRLIIWNQGDERAPNKPLLILYALGRWSQGDEGDIPFNDVNRDLTALLKEFGPERQVLHPEYPFWRLQKDCIWTVRSPVPLTINKNGDALKSELLAHNVPAGFSDEVKAALRGEPSLVPEIASRLLEEHFPDSLHPDILAAVGLSLGPKSPTDRKRDRQFRDRVLIAYEYRCAVCGFDVRIGSISIALDAAHIRWHQAGGPDQESNGLALCVLHHKIFDLGAFTLNHERVLLVSDRVNGSVGFVEALLSHHGKPIRPAQRPDWRPDPAFLEWHKREVFKGDARHLDLPAQ